MPHFADRVLEGVVAAESSLLSPSAISQLVGDALPRSFDFPSASLLETSCELAVPAFRIFRFMAIVIVGAIGRFLALVDHFRSDWYAVVLVLRRGRPAWGQMLFLHQG